MTISTVYRICGYATLIGLVMLFSLRILNIETGWMVWLSSGLFCGGLLIAVIMIIPLVRSSQGSDYAEILVLTFEGDDAEFGSPSFRERITSVAARIEARICDGETSEYDGDEYGAGVASLYFNTSSAKELFAKIQSTFQNDPEIRTSIAHRVTEGRSRIRLKWNTEEA